MLLQIVLGSAVIVLSTLLGVLGFLIVELGMNRLQVWLSRPPHTFKLLSILALAVLWMLALATVSIWLWAVLFRVLGLFVTFEAALYFAMVVFTTLGFGDVLLPADWRLLSGFASINGLLMIGLQVAFLMEMMRLARSTQGRGFLPRGDGRQ